MFQLYKSRNFGQYFHDTFDFLKKHGAHFFKNYLVVNGVFILILITMSYFFFKGYADLLTSNIGSRNSRFLEDYFNQNGAEVLIYILLFLIFGVIFMAINYAYTPIYLVLFEKNKGANFSSKDIVDALMKNAGKIGIYLLASILVAIPVALFAGVVSFILAITFIGIPLIIILIALVSLFFHSTLMEYLQTEKGIFDCFGYSANLCFQKFFPAVGSVAIFFIMAYIAQGVIVILQMIVTGFQAMTNPTTIEAQTETVSSMLFIFIAFQLVSTLLSLITGIMIQVNQSMVFYGLKEERENINTKSTIDQIGSGDS